MKTGLAWLAGVFGFGRGRTIVSNNADLPKCGDLGPMVDPVLSTYAVALNILTLSDDSVP